MRKTLPDGKQWHYRWDGAGQLTSVTRPDGYAVSFAYDALGRRISKRFRGRVTRWVWDGNKPLHEWQELEVGPGAGSVADLTTWLFEESSFAPLAKLTAQGSYSIVTDHLGTPLELYDQAGTQIWQAQLDSYGQVRAGRGKPQDCPFRYQGQYEDQETGLYYNRFRYYAPEEGIYLSQDPIRLAGGNKLYGYVKDTNGWMDPFGLACGKATIRQFENGHPEGHFSIEITDGTNTLHTHQVLTSEKHLPTTIIKGTSGDLGPHVNIKTIDIADATAAMDYQKALLPTASGVHTNLGPYDAISNSCLSHVADVINAGGGSIGKTRLGYAKFLRGNGFKLLR